MAGECRGARWRTVTLVVMLVPTALACSLLTDLGGLDDGQGVREVSDAGPATLKDGSDPPDPPIVPIDGAAGDAGPYHPKFQRRLTIRNNASTTLLAGTTQCFIVAAEGATGTVRPDLGDVRIFGATTERLRVIDLRGQLISVCFALERAIAPTASDLYFVRYDDPNAAAPEPAEKDLFPFWESFDGASAIDTNRWLVNGTVTVGGGILTLSRGGANAIASRPAQDGVPALASLEIRARVTDPNSPAGIQDSGEDFFYWFGFQHKGDFIAGEPWSVFIGRVPNVIRAEHKGLVGTTFTNCVGPDKAQSSDFRTYRIDRGQSETVFLADDNVPFRAAGTNGDESIMVRNFAVTSDLVVDWIRARPIVEPAPTLDVGSEEAAPP